MDQQQESIIENSGSILDWNEKVGVYSNKLVDWVIDLAPKIILATLVIWIGLFLVKKISKAITKGLGKANLDIEVTSFLGSIIDTALKLIVFAIAASIIGIKMSALVGLLAAAGFALGMALQGFLGNFASGITILFLKPYRVNDWVSISDSFGKVKSVQIFNTTLETPNDKTLIIPNGQVTDNIITNYSTMGNIRLELNVTMPYAENFPKVRKVIYDALKKSQYVIWDSEPLIGIEQYDSHNIVVAVRPYIKPDDFWEAKFEIYSLIKHGFSDNDIRAAYSEGVELGPIGQ